MAKNWAIAIGITESNPDVSAGEKSSSKLEEVESTSSELKTELKVFNFQVVTVNRAGKIVNEQSKSARYFTEDLGNGVTLDMVYIPGGKFLMGTDEKEIERLCQKYKVDYFKWEKPRHQVTVEPFFMGKFQVTQQQWKKIASLPQIKHKLEPDPSYFKGKEQPVEQVSWDEALEFCQRLSQSTGKEYRLPSEAEWEYACRAGTNTPFHFGETITDELANYRASVTYARESQGKYREQATPVGSFPPNAFGLYDLHGNIWEWCEDNWHGDYQGAPADGIAWRLGKSDIRVIRGGSWNLNPDYCRSAIRSYHSRDGRYLNIGFRVVCVAGKTT